MSNQTIERERGTGNGFGSNAGMGEDEFEDLVRGRDGHFVGENERGGELVDEGDMVEGVEEERGEQKGKGRGRKLGTGLVMLVAVFVVLGVCAWFAFGKGATRKAKVPVNANGPAGNAGSESEEAMTQRAIEQAGVAPGVAMPDGSVVRPGVMPPNLGVEPGSSVPVTTIPPVINPDLSSTINSVQPSTGGSSESVSGEAKQAVTRAASNFVSARNNEHSVTISEELKVSVEPRRMVTGREGGAGEGRKDENGIALPAFGTMLPVKSLGVLYTLRSGGLVRFELTRDVKGKGWSMPRGTILVGAARGAEYNRAFISLVGFIDTDSGRFVKIGGDLLGSDGGAGIRGQRKKMSSAWSKVLSRMGEAGLRVAESFAGSVGRRPIVISDAFGGYSGRVISEMDGAVLGRDRDTFVEVAAGSQGYMMITELPDAVQGVDALTKLSGEDLKARSDVDMPRRSTGISEQELAELIQSGDPERIKAALPRMTAEMRRVAEAVVSGDLAAR